jgi:lipopolysaccharide export system permease protein
MPILWRYLLSNFLKVTFFCVASFVGILLTMRLDEIAHFAALGAPLSYIFLFTLYQIPYILPIAIPISGLIAALIVIQRMSETHELTALRACGFALRDILAPLLLAAAFLVPFNFWIISEVATQSHLTTNSLKEEMRSVNPLLILNNKHFMRLKGIYFKALGSSRVGESASEVILALPNSNQQRLNLFIAQNLKAGPDAFLGQGVTLLTSLKSSTEETFDNLLIENIKESITLKEEFAQVMQKKSWTVHNDYLKASFLFIRMEEQKEELRLAKLDQKDPSEIKSIKAALAQTSSDLIRRLSLGLAAFTFTLMGAAFGINISRNKRRTGLFAAIFLTVFFLISFFVAKGVDRNFPLATSLYLGPHLIIILTSLFVLKRTTQGIE